MTEEIKRRINSTNAPSSSKNSPMLVDRRAGRDAWLGSCASTLVFIAAAATGVLMGLLVAHSGTTHVRWPCCDCAVFGGRRRLFGEETEEAPAIMGSDTGAPAPSAVSEAWDVAIHPLWMIASSAYTCLHCARNHRLALVGIITWLVSLCLSVAWSVVSTLLYAPPARVVGCCACPLSDVLAIPTVKDELWFWGGLSSVAAAPLISLVIHLMATADEPHEQSPVSPKRGSRSIHPADATHGEVGEL